MLDNNSKGLPKPTVPPLHLPGPAARGAKKSLK